MPRKAECDISVEHEKRDFFALQIYKKVINLTKFSYLCGSNYEQNLNFLEIMKRLTLLFAAVALAVSAVSAQVVQTPVKGKTGIRLYDKVGPLLDPR